MRWFVLFIVAILLFIIFAPIGFVYSIIDWLIDPSKLWRKARSLFVWIAISIDQLWNVVCWRLFNDILIKKRWYKFWDEDETISSVIGKNKIKSSLTFLWKLLYKILNTLEKDHSENAIEKL